MELNAARTVTHSRTGAPLGTITPLATGVDAWLIEGPGRPTGTFRWNEGLGSYTLQREGLRREGARDLSTAIAICLGAFAVA